MADIIGHSEPVLQPSAVVTDLWQTSQISGLRILALRIRRHTPRLLKAAGASRCWHLECAYSFGSSTATCFRVGSSNSSRRLVIPEAVATKSDCQVPTFSGYSGCLGKRWVLQCQLTTLSCKE